LKKKRKHSKNNTTPTPNTTNTTTKTLTMKRYIKIESKGIIQEEAFTLLGASSKTGDTTKIGFYGSGLKYSVAYLLREGIEFKVFGDYKEFAFSTERTTFRDKDFDVICVNGEKTSLTTAMGADWEAWFILREIYCNAIDEGESSITVVEIDACVPVEDKTVFYIEATDVFQKIIDNWNLYFSEKREDIVSFDLDFNKIYASSGDLIVYRKGIRCLFVKDEICSFNYDMTWAEINESRVIKNDWDFKYALVCHLQKLTDPKVIKHLYNTICHTYERTFRWDLSTSLYSDAWLTCLNKKILVPHENAGYWSEEVKVLKDQCLILPSILIEGLKSRFTNDIKVIGEVDGIDTKGELKIIKDLSRKQTQMLDDAKAFLVKANYPIKYEMKVVDFIKKNVLGQAKDNTILLSQKLFDMGRKQLVECIVEEQEHLETGFLDESRSFQSHFIGKYVTALEELTNTYL
jgi:hypothetical protein